MDPSNSSAPSLRYAGPRPAGGDAWKILLAAALALLAVATACINSLVVTAIAVTRKLHQPANYLICSLAATDLLVAALVMPVSIVYFVEEAWILGPVVCDLWLGVDVTCCTCSILHLAAIAVDRYRAIADAVAYGRKRTCRRALATIAAVWLLSALVSLPPLAWRRRRRADGWAAPTEKEGGAEKEAQDGGMMSSSEEGEEEEGDSCVIEHDQVAFALYSTFGAFYVPLVLILVLYYKIYRAAATLSHRRGAARSLSRHAVAGRVPPAENSGQEVPLSPDTLSPTEKSFPGSSAEGERARRISDPAAAAPSGAFHPLSARRSGAQTAARERRAATTLGFILGAFVVCWLPFFIMEVVVNTCESCSASAGLADFLTWLGYLNSFINPLIYTIFNRDFRRAFQKLLSSAQY